MVLLTNREKLTLRDQTRAPQEVFDTVVKKHKSFKKLHRLCADLGVDTQVFDLPEQREWARLADEGHGIMMDMLHFTPGRQSTTVKKYGLRLQHEDDEEMVLRCRGLYWQCCQLVAQVDSTSTAQQMLDSTILCNSKSSMTPSDLGGGPYDYNTCTVIQKNTKIYKAWKKEEEDVLVLQLECVYELALAYGIDTVSLMLGGRGKGAKSGRGGSHLKGVTQAHTLLSPAAQQMIVMPKQAYWHPQKMLASTWRCPPPLTECRVLANQLHAALMNTRQCRSRLRSSSLQVVEQQFDPENPVYLRQMAEKAAHGFGGSKESQAQKDGMLATQFGSGNETQAQLDGQLSGQFQSTEAVPFSRLKTLSIIKKKKTITMGVLYNALKRQHNRDKNEKRKFISFNTLRCKFEKRKGRFPKWVRDKVIVGKGKGKNKTLMWK